jgi:uncharacterized membrane protein
MAKVKLLLGSRKFWAALVGLVYIVAGNVFPDVFAKLPEQEQLIGVIVIVASYIFGTALEDGLRSK